MADRHVAGRRLSAFLDDELDEEDALQATRHLAHCERCLRELDDLRATRDALRRLPTLQAPVLTSGTERRGRHRRRLARRVGTLAAGALLPVLVVLAAYVLGGQVDGVEPTTERFLVEHVARTGGGAVPTPIGGGG